ncbi:MAG: hypothetical protein JNL09_06775 [Anaerolineales bacterium]|nr:hypothetical protein [Anaerolineales bacterium]
MMKTLHRLSAVWLLLLLTQLACGADGATPQPQDTPLVGRWACAASQPNCLPERLSIGDNDWFTERNRVEFFADGTLSTSSSERCLFRVVDEQTLEVGCYFGFTSYGYVIDGDKLMLDLHIATVELYRVP